MTDNEPRTLSALAAAHEFYAGHEGDGYNEPHEEWFGCSCGVVYWSHAQHADCQCHATGYYDEALAAPQHHVEHVLAMAIRARLARSRGRH